MSGMRPVLTEDALDAALGAARAVVFKHSTVCPVSAAAHAEVTRFVREHPDVPVYVIDVIADRALSRRAAERTGVRHESPQVYVVVDGSVAWHASHHAITADALAGHLGA